MSNQMFNLSETPLFQLSGAQPWLALLLYLALGLCLGSFATMAIHRWPAEEDWVRKRSYCPACGHTLAVTQLTPLFSWLWQRGRCAYCQAAIPFRYPLMELAAAACAALSLVLYGISITSVLITVLLVLLLIVVAVDIRHYIIPDQAQWGIAVTGLAQATLDGRLMPHALTALAAIGGGWVLAWAYRHIRHRDGLGMGDVKFFGAASCWLGPMGFLPFLCLGSILGTLFGFLWARKNLGMPFPFAPGLAVALAACALSPSLIIRFWEGMTALVQFLVATPV